MKRIITNEEKVGVVAEVVEKVRHWQSLGGLRAQELDSIERMLATAEAYSCKPSAKASRRLTAALAGSQSRLSRLRSRHHFEQNRSV